MDILGKTRINTKEIDGVVLYSTSVSNKNQDGTYDKLYIKVQLPKGHELQNFTTINITKGFVSMYKDKNGLPKPKFVIQEYEVIGSPEQEDVINYTATNELPF